MIQKRRREIEQDPIAQAAALIAHWCHENPSNDMNEFTAQAARALWLEERMFNNLAKVLGGKT